MEERVCNAWDTRERGVIAKRSVPGYAWVHWDDGRYFPVAEDSLVPESELKENNR
jgi:hypothetical protein